MDVRTRKEEWARFGIWRGLCGLVLDSLEKCLDLHVFLVNRSPHRANFDLPAEVSAAFEFRALTPGEVRRFAQDPALQMTSEFVESSLARHDYCFGVLQGDRLVAYDWRGLSEPVPLVEGLEVHYSYPGQVYGYAMYTRPECRGLRLQLYSVRRAEAHLLTEGHTHTIGYVALQNWASIRNLSRIPDQVFVGLAGYLRIAGRYLTFRTPGAKRFGFRIARAQPRNVRAASEASCPRGISQSEPSRASHSR